MVRSLVLRGALAGAVAGIVASVYSLLVAEPLVSAGIDYESARDEASDALAVAAGQAPAEAGPDVVSRGVQSTVGIATGVVGLGIALGLVLALAFALYLGRAGRIAPRRLALLLAAGGFGALYAVPFLKYPANPPSIGHESTISDRTGLYLVMVVSSVVVAVLAAVVGQRLAPRCGNWTATLLAGAGFVVVVGVIGGLLPSLGELAANVAAYGPQATETPQPLTDAAGRIVLGGFDADLLYEFRLSSIITQLLLWGVLGLVFAPLAERVVSSRPTTTAPVAAEPDAAPVG